ncbi:MAG: 4-(cytidine 5'-diphospho)-2-C-methyl-D-erythritol kinase [Pseudohongiellaceae bacterium]
MSDPPLTLLAPAKLNLFLHITGRRPDGYHELQTLFQLLDYGDTLAFRADDSGVLALHVEEESRYRRVPLENNLVLAAARRLQALAPANPGADIRLTKRIAPGAGLGGGSADAAITLLALNALWRLQLDTRQLMAIGLELGADVPVFVAGRSAWAEGVGERLEPVDLDPAYYLVLVPPVAVSTARIFAQENLTRQASAITIADFLAGRVRNDCESVTCALYPAVKKTLEWLGQHAPARMTGTGSAVFARFEDETEAHEVFGCRPQGLDGFVARGVNALEFDFRDI